MVTTTTLVRPDAAPSVAATSWVKRGARVTTILLSGRLLDGQTDYLCRVRNVSEGGMMIECHAAVAVGTVVRLELRHDIAIEAEVVWVAHPRMGVRALAPIDVHALLGMRRGRGRQTPRAPRLTAAAAIRISCCGAVHAGTLLDLSQGGGRIAMAERRTFDEPVRIAIPGLSVRPAVQRWVRDDQAGFTFLEPYSFMELSGWQEDRHSRFCDAA